MKRYDPKNWEIEYFEPEELKPYELNAKTHDEKQVRNIANSIRRFGWKQPAVITSDKVLVIGHGRRLAAIKLGCKVPCVVIDKQAEELTDEDIKELRLADNLTNESAWNFELRAKDIEGLNFEGFDFAFTENEVKEAAKNPYDDKVKIPQYEPTEENTDLSELVESEKSLALIEEIDQSGLSQQEKDFLKFAAYRHLKFNYKKIANYYASASPEMQRLMERSALVIIDYDDAIANGYTRLSESIKGMFDYVEE